jgi:zinc/manganese transport system permease protein
MLYAALFAPFTEHDNLRRALVACCALAVGGGPIGVFLMLRRMSLMGDALSHAILPGAAIGFLFAGLNLVAMTIGGIAAGLLVALLAGLVARATELKEDASFAALFSISVATGVVIVSLRGSDQDLVHFLFGDVASVSAPALLLIATISTVSLAVLALIWRPLVLECVDPGFLRSVSRAGAPVHAAFMALTVFDLVAGFQALGTLLAVGLMMLPAFAARLWARDITSMVLIAAAAGIASGYLGLLLSFHAAVAAGPSIILAAGAIYVASVLLGRSGGLFRGVHHRRHLEA